MSEVFPPQVGGSGALLDNLYRRLDTIPVRVLTHGRDATRMHGRLPVEHVSMTAPDWGVVRPASLGRHLRVARQIRRLAQKGWEVHCGRALPEGLSALMATLAGGPAYSCWTHGEELGFASTSTELTALLRLVHRRAHRVFANSQNSARLLIDAWGVDPKRVDVIYPGVDAERFSEDLNGATVRLRTAGPGEVVFLSVGRLQRRKGHDLVIRALPGVRARVPSARYVIVGDGPMKGELQSLAYQCRVTDAVHFAGVVPEHELPQWYRAADVFVMPNRTDGVDFEGFGMVFLEAAASGLPVVAGRSGGAPETVADGTTGMLVDDLDSLTAALVAMAMDANLRRRFGSAGALRARRDFEWAASVRRLRLALDNPGTGS